MNKNIINVHVGSTRGIRTKTWRNHIWFTSYKDSVNHAIITIYKGLVLIVPPFTINKKLKLPVNRNKTWISVSELAIDMHARVGTKHASTWYHIKMSKDTRTFLHVCSYSSISTQHNLKREIITKWSYLDANKMSTHIVNQHMIYLKLQLNELSLPLPGIQDNL